MTSSNDKILQPETLAAQGGGHVDYAQGAISPPIVPSTTFLRRAQDYELVGTTGYSRDHNPSSEPAEKVLAALERGKGAYVFASGLAAGAAVVLALEPGDHIVA
ncbi:MAG: PLP-dependent transferase, partial [Kiloniellales bacterium]|nr:PLP-dependent transferase [Kiloniellales bacterium]